MSIYSIFIRDYLLYLARQVVIHKLSIGGTMLSCKVLVVAPLAAHLWGLGS